MSKSFKLVWRVQPAPTGLYRSFDRRGWPIASFGKDGNPAAQLLCEDDYKPNWIGHKPLKISVADYSQVPFAWRHLKVTAETLSAAKARVDAFYDHHHDWLPKELQ